MFRNNIPKKQGVLLAPWPAQSVHYMSDVQNLLCVVVRTLPNVIGFFSVNLIVPEGFLHFTYTYSLQCSDAAFIGGFGSSQKILKSKNNTTHAAPLLRVLPHHTRRVRAPPCARPPAGAGRPGWPQRCPAPPRDAWFPRRK